MQKQIPITGIPAHAEYHEFHEESWHKGFIIRNQTTVRLRRYHLQLLQGIAMELPLFLPRQMDLSRWEFGHAGILVRSLARVQLRDQLVECDAPPAVFIKQQPRGHDEVLTCCFQSAKRCEVDLDLEGLRDTMLDILILPREVMIPALTQDAEFCMDDKKTLEQWNPCFSQFRGIRCEGDLKYPSDMKFQ